MLIVVFTEWWCTGGSQEYNFAKDLGFLQTCGGLPGPRSIALQQKKILFVTFISEIRTLTTFSQIRIQNSKEKIPKVKGKNTDKFRFRSGQIQGTYSYMKP